MKQTNPSSEAELREQVNRILEAKHPECFYRPTTFKIDKQVIIEWLVELFHQRERQARKEYIEKVYRKITNHELYNIQQVVDYLDEVFKSLEEEE